MSRDGSSLRTGTSFVDQCLTPLIPKCTASKTFIFSYTDYPSRSARTESSPSSEFMFPLPPPSRRRQIYGYAVDNDWLYEYAVRNNLAGPEYSYTLSAITHIIEMNNLERRLWAVWVGEGPDRKHVCAFAVGSNRSRAAMMKTITPKRVENLQRILGRTDLPTWMELAI